MTARPQFTITLEPVPGHPAPVHRRLARLLKAMLRGYGFRCVKASETQPTTQDETPKTNT